MTFYLLFGGWIIIVGFWLLNHFYYKNVKYEEEYRRGLHPRK
jgi:hypothetical protein